MKIRDLKPDDKNANRGTDRGRTMLAKSLEQYGAGRSILIDKDGRVIAGNKTLEQAIAAGHTDVVVVKTDGSQLVAVQRTDLDLSDPKARALAIADNRVGEMNLSWDADILAGFEDKAELGSFFSNKELGEIWGEPEPSGEAPEPKIDEAAALQKQWRTKAGQLWLVGQHRLLCGDSTTQADVERLMGTQRAQMAFTDPPWNAAIGQDSNPRHRQREGLQNDSLPDADFCTFLRGFSGQMAAVTDGDVYCVMGSGEWPNMDREMRATGFHWSATIIWVKDLFVLGRSKYHRRYEPIWYGWHTKGKSSFGKARDLDDVWEIPRPRISLTHPTMKPVELPARAIANSSRVGDIVYEPFCGAGSTMAAAEQLKRKCYALEIEPKYVAVILQRLSEMGVKPELSGE